MALKVSEKFSNSLQLKQTNLTPLVVIGNWNSNQQYDHGYEWSEGLNNEWLQNSYLISTDASGVSGYKFLPLLLNIPYSKESIDIVNRRYQVSSLNVQISDMVYNDKRFSNIIGKNSLLNVECRVFWMSEGTDFICPLDIAGDRVPENLEPYNAFQYYNGIIKKVKHGKSYDLVIEDQSQRLLNKEVPSVDLGTGKEVPDKYKNAVVPITYGVVENSPCVVIRKNPQDMDNQIDPDDNKRLEIICDRESGGGTASDVPYFNPKIKELKVLVNDHLLTVSQTTESYRANSERICTYKTGLEQYNISGHKANLITVYNDSVIDCNPVSNDQIIAYKVFKMDQMEFKPLREKTDYFSYIAGNVWIGDCYYSSIINPFTKHVMGTIVCERKDNDIYTWNETSALEAMPQFFQGSGNNQWQLGGTAEDINFDYTLQTDLNNQFMIGCKINTNILSGFNEKETDEESEFHKEFIKQEVVVDYDFNIWTGNWYRVADQSHGDLWFRVTDNVETLYQHIKLIPTASAGNSVDENGDYIWYYNGSHSTSDGSALFELKDDPSTIHAIFQLMPHHEEYGQLVQSGVYPAASGAAMFQPERINVTQSVLLDGLVGLDYYAKVEGRMANADYRSAAMIFNHLLAYEVYNETTNPMPYYQYNGYNNQGKINNPHQFNENTGFSNFTHSYSNYFNWQYDFTLTERKTLKKLFEELGSVSGYFPRFNSQGHFVINRIPEYIWIREDENKFVSDHIINSDDVIDFKFSRTEQLYTKVKYKYNFNYATEKHEDEVIVQIGNNGDIAFRRFEGFDEQYSFDYNGVNSDHSKSTLLIDDERSNYIKSEDTATRYAKWMLRNHANPHLELDLKLPLKWMTIEVGDFCQLDRLIASVGSQPDKLPFGINYALDAETMVEGYNYLNGEPVKIYGDIVNGQQVFPVFMCTQVSRKLDHVQVKLYQLHNLHDNLMTGDIIGVTNPIAWNYNPNATLDSGGELIPPVYDDNGNMISDANPMFKFLFLQHYCPYFNIDNTYYANYPHEQYDEQPLYDISQNDEMFNYDTQSGLDGAKNYFLQGLDLSTGASDTNPKLYSMSRCVTTGVSEHGLSKVGFGIGWNMVYTKDFTPYYNYTDTDEYGYLNYILPDLMFGQTGISYNNYFINLVEVFNATWFASYFNQWNQGLPIYIKPYLSSFGADQSNPINQCTFADGGELQITMLSAEYRVQPPSGSGAYSSWQPLSNARIRLGMDQVLEQGQPVIYNVPDAPYTGNSFLQHNGLDNWYPEINNPLFIVGLDFPFTGYNSGQVQWEDDNAANNWFYSNYRLWFKIKFINSMGSIEWEIDFPFQFGEQSLFSVD